MASFTYRCHYHSLFFLLLLFASQCRLTMSASRPLQSSASTLVARLKLLDDETRTTTCWETLIQLHACTGEIILFFVNGETYIGKSCCEAIRTITHRCWPSMIDSLGFTTEEGDILDTYCTITAASTPDSPLPATPPPAAAVSLQV